MRGPTICRDRNNYSPLALEIEKTFFIFHMHAFAKPSLASIADSLEHCGEPDNSDPGLKVRKHAELSLEGLERSPPE